MNKSHIHEQGLVLRGVTAKPRALLALKALLTEDKEGAVARDYVAEKINSMLNSPEPEGILDSERLALFNKLVIEYAKTHTEGR